MTLHHEENVDYKEELTNLVEGIIAIGERFQVPVIFPIHPRTRLRLKYFDLESKVEASRFLKPIVPVGYFDFLMLIAHAKLIMTDSGGLTQEAAILKVPCLTLGKYTDWTETVDIGANMIGMNDPSTMVQAAAELIGRDRHWPEPFGPPGASKRIVEILKGTFTEPQVS
jgi:UDP-N-acetylglucosamine 2-epimerase (non-hydrolysing)